MTATTAPAPKKPTNGPSGRPGARREGLLAWFMAGPALFLLAIFLIAPFLLGFWLGLTDQRLISPNPAEFVGLDNYKELLSLEVLTLDAVVDETGAVVVDEDGNTVYPSLRDFTRDEENYPQYHRMQEWMQWNIGESRIILLARDVVFMKALVNTLIFALLIVPLQGGLGLLLALLINKRIRGVNIFRTIYFVPVVMSMVVVALLWRFMYGADDGLINSMLGTVTLGAMEPVDWLGNTDTALGAILVTSVWQGVGFHMVIWLAGLQTIPYVLYEAAQIDGAGRWGQFRNVTIPGLRNTIVFVVIVITIQAFGLFVQVNEMTRGGPLDATQSVIFQAVQRGYEKSDIAMGSTISVVFFALVLIVSLFQRFLMRDKS